MGKNRLEAFSDGVIAILITIMVLELKVPSAPDFTALREIAPLLGAYVLSFIFLGTYWNNHHHMLHAADHVSGAVLWANLHLLFWLSLVPFVTRWMGEFHRDAVPVAIYGGVLLCSAIAYGILQATIIRAHGPKSRLATAVKNGTKEKISTACYLAAIGLAFVDTRFSFALFVIVELIWFIPDRRIERALGE